MSNFAPIRALALAAALAVSASAQIPATPPTAAPAPALSAAPQAPLKPSAQPAHRAQVSFDGGLLSVVADNSSLNQILRDVGRQTGMKITGGVVDERVYGTYGPDNSSIILSALLRGTGSNMLLIFNNDASPQELVLTPRSGGVTPPSPAAQAGRDEEDLPPQRQQRFQRPQGVPLPEAAPAPVPQQPQTALPPQAAPVPTAPPDTTTEQSPNGVKTPQQIYDQLMKMQQQQQKPPAGSTPQ